MEYDMGHIPGFMAVEEVRASVMAQDSNPTTREAQARGHRGMTVRPGMERDFKARGAQ